VTVSYLLQRAGKSVNTASAGIFRNLLYSLKTISRSSPVEVTKITVQLATENFRSGGDTRITLSAVSHAGYLRRHTSDS